MGKKKTSERGQSPEKEDSPSETITPVEDIAHSKEEVGTVAVPKINAN